MFSHKTRKYNQLFSRELKKTKNGGDLEIIVGSSLAPASKKKTLCNIL